MSDVILSQIIGLAFWLILLFAAGGVVCLVFREEIKSLLLSIGSLKVAGSSFKFRDRKETFESYIILAETLIDLLSRSNIEAIRGLLVPSQVEQLLKFINKYTAEVDQQYWNEQMVQNIAYILLRAGRYTDALRLFDKLLERFPNNINVLNLKALSLITTRLQEQVDKALPILEDLVSRYPEVPNYRLNYALAKSLSSSHEDAINQMKLLIQSPYLRVNPGLLEDPLFYKTREEKKEDFRLLQTLLSSELQKLESGK